jgi:hypothetical protein
MTEFFRNWLGLLLRSLIEILIVSFRLFRARCLRSLPTRDHVGDADRLAVVYRLVFVRHFTAQSLGAAVACVPIGDKNGSCCQGGNRVRRIEHDRISDSMNNRTREQEGLAGNRDRAGFSMAPRAGVRGRQEGEKQQRDHARGRTSARSRFATAQRLHALSKKLFSRQFGRFSWSPGVFKEKASRDFPRCLLGVVAAPQRFESRTRTKKVDRRARVDAANCVDSEHK